jgi:PAS domain S-box-containing protein
MPRKKEVKVESSDLFEARKSLINVIEELSEAHEKLDGSEERYRTLVETSPDAITFTDLIGKFIMVNKRAAVLHGFKSVEEMLSSGKDAFDFIAREDGKRAIDNVKRTLEAGSIRNAEYTLLREDGTTVPAELSASVFTGPKGKPRGFIGVIRDISERKKAEINLQEAYNKMEECVADRTSELAKTNEELKKTIRELRKTEEELRHSEERFRIVTEGALAGVYMVQNYKFVYVNPAFAHIFGFTTDELIDKKGPLEVTHPDDQALVAEQMRRRLSNEKEHMRYNFRGLRKDGTVIHCEVMSRRHEYKGTPTIIGILLDVTQGKKAEDEMRKMLMKYSLNEGSVYLVEEPSRTISIEAFKELLKVGYQGYVFSRVPREEFRRIVEGDYDFSWLSEKGEKALTPKIREIQLFIENLPNRNAILIERLDYIIFKNGFNETLNFLQRLRDVAYLSGHIIIMSVDPKTISKKELRLIEKESKEIEMLHKGQLPDDLLEALRFINKQNTIGVKPSYAEVGRNLGISKPTVQKRIKRLNSAGYLLESVNGRRKSVEISEKGRNLFYR